MADQTLIIPRVPQLPARRDNTIATALESQGVTREGLISDLLRIAQTGEKVTITKKRGVVVEEKIVRDPELQMKAIEKLSTLIDRAEGKGAVTRELHMRETRSVD